MSHPVARFTSRISIAATSTVAVSLAFALSGCDLMKRNEDALATINQRVIGMPSGTFFDRYGRANSRVENADGSTRYLWESKVGFAAPGPNGLDDRVCRLRLMADRQGRISAVEVELDAPGVTSTSRCREIFAPA